MALSSESNNTALQRAAVTTSAVRGRERRMGDPFSALNDIVIYIGAVSAGRTSLRNEERALVMSIDDLRNA